MSTRIDHNWPVGRGYFPTLGADGWDLSFAFFLHAFLQKREVAHLEAQPLSKLTSAGQVSIFRLAEYLPVQFVDIAGKDLILRNRLNVSCHDPVEDLLGQACKSLLNI